MFTIIQQYERAVQQDIERSVKNKRAFHEDDEYFLTQDPENYKPKPNTAFWDLLCGLAVLFSGGVVH